MLKIITSRSAMANQIFENFQTNESSKIYSITDFFYRKKIKAFLMRNKYASGLKLFSMAILNKFKDCNDDCVVYFGMESIYHISLVAFRWGKPKKHCLWLWNPISTIGRSNWYVQCMFFLVRLCDIEIWTFDHDDAKKYNLKYHHQIYSFPKSTSPEKQKTEYDIFFVGKDKGRLRKLETLVQSLKSKNISSKIIVIPDKNKFYNESQKKLLSTKTVKYSDYIEILKKSKCVLEITQSGQSGFTLRTLEALFFNKKLITDNKNIANYDFYNRNMLIVNDEDFSNADLIKKFIDSDLKPLELEKLNKYDVRNLINNMFKDVGM